MSEAEPQGFWDVFKRFQTAAAAGEQQTAREYLDKAASFPAAHAVPALTERVRLRFIGLPTRSGLWSESPKTLK